MLTINKELTISIDANLDDAVARRVSFKTENNHIFYLEFAMDKTEFIKLDEFEYDEEFDPDSLLEQHGVSGTQASNVESTPWSRMADKPAISQHHTNVDADDLLDELGI